MPRIFTTLLLVLALAAGAAAQSCPSKVCTTGGVGPIDCCKHDFKANSKCYWNGTPVSFTAGGTCVLDGKTYMITNESNSKGPPGNSTPCRCASPSVNGATKPMPANPPTAPASLSSYRILQGYDIVGKDIPSNGQPYTRICTGSSGYKGKFGYDAYVLMCADTKGCVAATTERSSSGCAYLKSAGKRGDITQNSGWVVLTAAEGPPPACRYANQGEKCTTDVWASECIRCGGNKTYCDNGVCKSSYPSSG